MVSSSFSPREDKMPNLFGEQGIGARLTGNEVGVLVGVLPTDENTPVTQLNANSLTVKDAALTFAASNANKLIKVTAGTGTPFSNLKRGSRFYADFADSGTNPLPDGVEGDVVGVAASGGSIYLANLRSGEGDDVEIKTAIASKKFDWCGVNFVVVGREVTSSSSQDGATNTISEKSLGSRKVGVVGAKPTIQQTYSTSISATITATYNLSEDGDAVLDRLKNLALQHANLSVIVRHCEVNNLANGIIMGASVVPSSFIDGADAEGVPTTSLTFTATQLPRSTAKMPAAPTA